MLGCSIDFFNDKVWPQLRAVRISSQKPLIPVRQLELWLEKHAEFPGEY